MSYKQKYPTESDIYNLYRFYESYKQYYEYYWTHQNAKLFGKEDIKKYRTDLISNRKKLGNGIDALCYLVQVSKKELEEMNEIEALDKFLEECYGETND